MLMNNSIAAENIRMINRQVADLSFRRAFSFTLGGWGAQINVCFIFSEVIFSTPPLILKNRLGRSGWGSYGGDLSMRYKFAVIFQGGNDLGMIVLLFVLFLLLYLSLNIFLKQVEYIIMHNLDFDLCKFDNGILFLRLWFIEVCIFLITHTIFLFVS